MSSSSASSIIATMSSAPRTLSPKTRGSKQVSIYDSSDTKSSLDRPRKKGDSVAFSYDICDDFSGLVVGRSTCDSPLSSTQGSDTETLSTRHRLFQQAIWKLSPMSKPRPLTLDKLRRRYFWRRNENRDWEPVLSTVSEDEGEVQDDDPKKDNDDLDYGWVEMDLADEVWSMYSNDSTLAVDKAEPKEEASKQEAEGIRATSAAHCGAEHQERWHPRVHPVFAARYGNDPNWRMDGARYLYYTGF
ncbi:hypothetical protein F5Y05DRAFT_67835 [Hypoxylon sp. FL0543]|nr:hypothetical protein F5Y05DRAFT_67835 [Hypoxylon sp. FL0543]